MLLQVFLGGLGVGGCRMLMIDSCDSGDDVHPRKLTWIPKIMPKLEGDTTSKKHHFWLSVLNFGGE